MIKNKKKILVGFLGVAFTGLAVLFRVLSFY